MTNRELIRLSRTMPKATIQGACEAANAAAADWPGLPKTLLTAAQVATVELVVIQAGALRYLDRCPSCPGGTNK